MPQAVTAVLWNPQLMVNSVDLSGKARKAKVTISQQKKPVTAFGNTDVSNLASLRECSAEIEFYLDRATGGVIQTLRALVSGPGSASFPLACRALNSAATTSNEVYSMSVIIDGALDLINGAVGDVETTTVKFASASTTGWAVATTS